MADIEGAKAAAKAAQAAKVNNPWKKYEGFVARVGDLQGVQVSPLGEANIFDPEKAAANAKLLEALKNAVMAETETETETEEPKKFRKEVTLAELQAQAQRSMGPSSEHGEEENSGKLSYEFGGEQIPSPDELARRLAGGPLRRSKKPEEGSDKSEA